MTVDGLSLSIDDGIARLLIERESRGNSFTPEMLDAVPGLLQRAAEAGARVLVVRGQGSRAFCAGYDLQRLSETFDDEADSGGEALQRAVSALEAFPGATVAMVNGPAIGGGVLLSLACDLRFARDTAWFRIPVARLGLIYPLKGIRALLAAVGSGRCLEMLHTARKVDAAEALDWGLVNAVGSGEGWDAAGEEAIEAMKQAAPLSLEGHHVLLRHLIHGDLDPNMAQRVAATALQSKDASEGAAAVREKRSPRFIGE